MGRPRLTDEQRAIRKQEIKEYYARYWIEHKDEIKARRQAMKEANPEGYTAKLREYFAHQKERQIADGTYEAKHERQKALARARYAKRKAAQTDEPVRPRTPQKIRTKTAEWNAYWREYYQKNKERLLAKRKARYDPAKAHETYLRQKQKKEKNGDNI